jgi:hypothetical protein
VNKLGDIGEALKRCILSRAKLGRILEVPRQRFYSFISAAVRPSRTIIPQQLESLESISQSCVIRVVCIGFAATTRFKVLAKIFNCQVTATSAFAFDRQERIAGARRFHSGSFDPTGRGSPDPTSTTD